MLHVMSLYKRPFMAIRERTKHIEVRCNDEKRKLIQVGDEIVFRLLPDEKDTIRTRFVSLHPFKSFQELYSSFEFSEFGCEGSMLEKMIENTRKIYSIEREIKEGVLGIRIELVEGSTK